MPDTPKLPAFLGLDFAQWAVILREVAKTAGFVAVTTGVYSQTDVNTILQAGDYVLKGAQFLGGGGLILGPIIYQIIQRRANARIKDVASLPQVKGIVTDAKTAQVDLKDVPNVVAHATDIPKEKVL